MAKHSRQNSTSSPWFDTTEAAAYLRLSSASMRTFRSIGTGPAYHKVGRAVRYHVEDLDEYVRKGRQDR